MSLKIILNGSSEPASLQLCQQTVDSLSYAYDCFITFTDKIIKNNDELDITYQQVIYEFSKKNS